MKTAKKCFVKKKKLHEVILEDMNMYALEAGTSQTARASIRKAGTYLREADFSKETREEIAVEILEIRDKIPKFPQAERFIQYLEKLSQKIYLGSLIENTSLATMPS